MAPSDSTKQVLKDVIEIYRTHPCLWQIKSKEYHDRDKKEAAFKLFIEKLRKIEPDANKAVVVRKINNLKSNVRKEKKKYESLTSRASADDVYYVKLWYYDLFNFLHDQCTGNFHSTWIVMTKIVAGLVKYLYLVMYFFIKKGIL